jgi:hypothetical protein
LDDFARVKLLGDLAHGLVTVRKVHRGGAANDSERPGFAEITDNVIRHAFREIGILERRKICERQHCKGRQDAGRDWWRREILQKKVPDLSGSEDKNHHDDGIQQKTEIAEKNGLRVLLGMRRRLRFLRSRDGGPPTCPPVIYFRFISVNGIVLPVPMTVNWQAFACFPSLSCPNISLQIGTYFFPGIETVGHLSRSW